ncbi:H4MPT-linked C1 transfer pathway protein [Methylococcaceae bacterium CS1]|nr:H4MPT-linked C1 transfer pathway protein [Methyloprofundus sp.]TXK98565.1 H4MPT-linked C1 transfer pathway protein [Methylococcaceae bacterium CS4]TXL00540.1 H4MPT-linked C1 transfer pathway protein [Methylococcaceae bacterium CS5]TXL05059.1 H4MPT-linked C1 transfer pathway protein [Methylococcaceae bacterium CS3]TXL07873.1 H4MPT-linked C1 transfer pathway protein [Methylococcaceae bacterium CS1]TXL11498.1 H4MPT-linked C1 transfer pathway protein [Methylococcaceae bacterium CS2]
MQVNDSARKMIGWDIGGAHLKAALLNAKGDICAVYQEPCSLWQGLDKLENALANVLEKLPSKQVQHVITMSGELVDLFSDRAQGVTEIIAVSQRVLAQQTILVYAGRLGMIPASEITSEYIDDIASANWLASTIYAAQKLEQGLLVDVGSTTTDLLLLQNNQPDILGYTDFQRLGSGELVYTGIIRTAVMAVAQSVQFSAIQVGVMSEYFATMSDVYRLTHELNEQHDQCDTADGHAKTEPASARRLARMIGCDVADYSSEQWRQLAYAVREQQLCRIQAACERQLMRVHDSKKNLIIGAGVGRFLIKDIASRLGIEYRDFDTLFNTAAQENEMHIADCAPAVAVAYLAIDGACKSNIC